MPYRRPKRSYVLPVAVLMVVASPLTVLAFSESGDYRFSTESSGIGQPTQMAEVALSTVGDVLVPLRELSGLELPDLAPADLLPLPGPQSTFETSPGSNGFIASAGESDTTSADPIDRVGAQVKQLTRDTPFSMVALTAQDLADATAVVRARHPDGAWGPWYEADTGDTVGAHQPGKGGTSGTEPIYVGDTNAVQILVTRKPSGSSLASIASPEPVSAADSAVPRSDEPAHATPELTAVLLDPSHGGADANLSAIAAPLPGGGPKVITRAQWGADESLRCEEPTYDDQVGGIVVHHTAGRNEYTREESAGIVRAIYAYHAKTLGWCDIGYNALVDKYGQVFEGRYGGLDRPVQGAHAGGFNENTAGVALMGDHESEPPTEAAIQAIGQFIGWRARLAGLNPKGYTTMWSEGTEFTPYTKDERVQVPIVFSHRDVGNTACAGDAAYAAMDRIRDIAAATIGAPPATAAGPDSQYTPRARNTQPRDQTDMTALATLAGELWGFLKSQRAAAQPSGAAVVDVPAAGPGAVEDGVLYQPTK